ncbi:MAG: hypothetical protein ACFFC7_11595 [Candidatus Hermodarchaeota archaeon]
MIEVFNKMGKLEGYIDGKQYLDRKKRLIGFLEENVAKDKTGYPLLILKDNGEITWNEGELQGYLKDSKIYNLQDDLIFEFLKEDGKINNSKEEVVLDLRGNLEEIEDIDFFGIAAIFLELFA